MLSGPYRDNWLMRHFSSSNDGKCSLCSFIKGDLEHYLRNCCKLSHQRLTIIDWWLYECQQNYCLISLLQSKLEAPSNVFIKFLVNPSSDADVVYLIQHGLLQLDTIYKLTRTYCYSIHRERLKIINDQEKCPVTP